MLTSAACSKEVHTSVFWFKGWARDRMGRDGDGNTWLEWGWEITSESQPKAFPCSITRDDQERAVKCVLKCFYAKITCELFHQQKEDADASSKDFCPELGAPATSTSHHLLSPPFFWHTRCAVQWQVSQDRLHRIGQSDHFCLRRTESKFFQCIFFSSKALILNFGSGRSETSCAFVGG